MRDEQRVEVGAAALFAHARAWRHSLALRLASAEGGKLFALGETDASPPSDQSGTREDAAGGVTKSELEISASTTARDPDDAKQKAEASLSEAKQKLAKAEAEREKAMAERDEAKARYAKAQMKLDEAEKQRNELQKQYDASSVDEKARLEPRLNEAKKEVERLNEQFNRADDFLKDATTTAVTRADDYVKSLMNLPKSPTWANTEGTRALYMIALE